MSSKPMKNHRTYLRKGDHRFVLLAIFLTHAKKRQWNQNEINIVLNKAKGGNYDHFYNTLNNCMNYNK